MTPPVDSRHTEVKARLNVLVRQAAATGWQAGHALGLGSTDLRALVALDAMADRPVRVKDLAAAVGLSSAATTALVDRLEDAGLIMRQADSSDRRSVTLSLQPRARKIGRQLLEPWSARIEAAVVSLDPERAAVVADFLDSLLTSPDGPDDGGPR